MKDVKYIKAEGQKFILGQYVYIDKDTGYAVSGGDSTKVFPVGTCVKKSGIKTKTVLVNTGFENTILKRNSPGYFKKASKGGIAEKKTRKDSVEEMKKVSEIEIIRKRGGKSFGMFHEMLQKAKEGNNVVYVSLLGNFEIRYIQPQDNSGGINFDPLCRGFGYEEDGHIEDSMGYASRQDNRDGIKKEITQKNKLRESLKSDLNPLKTLKDFRNIILLLIFRAVAIILSLL